MIKSYVPTYLHTIRPVSYTYLTGTLGLWIAPSLCCKVLVYSVNYNFCLNKISLNFYRIISETAFPFSQSHTAVFTCGFNQEFTLLYGQFLTVWCQNCQVGGGAQDKNLSQDIPRICIGSRFKTSFF